MNKRGFIALVSTLIIGAILLSILLSSSEPIMQYRQTIDLKMKAVQKLNIKNEQKDEEIFESFIKS